MNQTAYVQITSSNIGLHQPQVEPWHQRSEREMLNRSRPGPSADALEIEKRLMDQVAGKQRPEVSPQLAAQWATRKQSRREVDLEETLYQQISGGHVR